MMELVGALSLGLVLGAGFGFLLGRDRGECTERRRHATTAPSSSVTAATDAPPPAPTAYEIRRNGRPLWTGTDPHLAKTWWEHAKRQPGRRSLVFLQNQKRRDDFHASE